MIHAGAWLETEHDTMEAVACGRPPTSDADCELQIVGRHLALTITLFGGTEIRLAASPADNAGAPETILRSHDDATGWDTVRRLCSALERNEIKTLRPRPVEIPSDWEHPNDGWIIA